MNKEEIQKQIEALKQEISIHNNIVNIRINQISKLLNDVDYKQMIEEAEQQRKDFIDSIIK